jgi:hypothetical protein
VRAARLFGVSHPILRMFGDPLGGLFFGGETLDHFRLAIRPKNIDHQPSPGFFRAMKTGRCSDIRRICACCKPDQASLAASSVAAMRPWESRGAIILTWPVVVVAAA